ncbi:ANR family transcriptional regulator [Vibrio parahaemolyticus]|uniref:ANR family transcriptional regulator n=1 Tax=Vibrio parahaemolyticus TaxID=670 RepID=UPI001E328BDE|nr:ANR family transcriptional regulator [Vibrio parahaemolyticus]
MVKENTFYIEKAEQACTLERENDWKEAARYWESAASHATKHINHRWATSRKTFCLKRTNVKLKNSSITRQMSPKNQNEKV